MVRHASGTIPPQSVPGARRRVVWLVGLLLGLPVGLGACKGVRANSHVRYPREVSYGGTSTCPDVRMPPLRDGNVSTDAARCSYSDFNGSKVTHLAGKVVAEVGPASPGTGVAEVQVTVHRVQGRAFAIEAPGPALARSVTDAQGNYSVRGVFEPGDVAILVSESTGAPLATRIVRVDKSAVGSLKGLLVVIPLDAALAAAASVAPPSAVGDAPATSTAPLPSTPEALRLRQGGTAPRVPDPQHAPAPNP
jgi:hypothetical protein